MVRYLLLLFFAVNLTSFAQTERYRFTRIDADKGVSHNQIKTFFKDRQGFMWFGTISGLNRFDGYNIKVFRNDPNDSVSLLHDDINRMFEDPDGRIWISTWNGLDIYDPYTETFRFDPSDMLERYGIPDRNLSDIVRDRLGNYWFIHASKGIFYFNKEQSKTYHLNYVDVNIYTIASNDVSAAKAGLRDNMWVIHRNGIIESINPATLKVTLRDSSLYHRYSGQRQDYRFISDHDNNLWVYMADSNQGIYKFDDNLHTIRHITSTSQGLRLNSDIVRGVVEDSHNNIWIATDHGGINIINTKTNDVSYVLHSEGDKYSLSQNSVNSLYKDRDGIIWAGTFKRGVNYYHENIIRFPLLKRQLNDPESLPSDDINAFAEDEKGNLWIGTNGGGLIYYDRSNETFRQFVHDPKNHNSLSTNIIVSLCYDSRNRLWIGTYFGGLNVFENGKFTRLSNGNNDQMNVSDNSIWEIFEDSKGRLYVGTLANGLEVFDKSGRKIASYSNGVPNTIHGNYVPAIMEDAAGKIWIGTGYGVEVFDPQSGTFTHYLSTPGEKSTLSNNSIISLLEDQRGGIWIGTRGGLNLFDKTTKTFRVFTTDDGLPHSSILGILEDSEGNLWLSTPSGLSNLKMTIDGDSVRYHFFNFDQFDGLQGKQFNENAALKTKKGEMVFGGANGFNIFQPEAIPENLIVPPVVVTDLQVLNTSIRPNQLYDGKRILTKAVSLTEGIELRHKDNVFSIEFAVLSFNHPEKSQYRYMLEGFDKTWIPTTAEQRKVTYTNLDPGVYTFRVIASNNDGVWNEQGVKLQITVLPPFWKTGYAYAAYVVLILGGLFITRKLVQQRERMKYAIEHERREAQRMHELDMMKIKFFTNVSHEFRTPLTLILTPLERILKKPGEVVQPGQFELIYRNAKRLLNLVNQLLDFRKLEVQEVKFNPSEGDVVSFIQETVFSFSDLSEKKGIPLHFKSTTDHFETIFDQDKLEKILFNLLSNAFKFTPEGGEVSVDLIVEDASRVVLKVTDTGIGIPADKIERVFDRFFQHELPRTMVNQGSGIGLSITREFVKVHNGTITVESEIGKGTCFTVTLPLKEVQALHDVNLVNETEITEERSVEVNEKLPSLLLVEDNDDFRFYLKDNLSLQYNIIEAKEGREGWDKVISRLPDLVVTDIMMPGMNGIDLCRKIKNDPRVSHTPVILLTARTAEEQKLEGFESGAEDYITKPFSFEILQSRIRNLILQRENLQKEFPRRIDVKASNVQITSLDEKLISKALKVVESRLSDADFTVEELARELGMSRVHLYKKLQALTGKSPIEFIRTLRLQHAAQLLEKSQLTVSEIAYKVGFNNPKYFARYFKEEYKMLPSAYSSSHRKE